jgi:hypothetical protein
MNLERPDLLDTGFRRYDELVVRRGECTLSGFTPSGIVWWRRCSPNLRAFSFQSTV